MQIKSFVFSPMAENTYVVFDETGEAVVIDPGCYTQHEKEQLKSFIIDNNLQLKAILLTHAHLDHVFGVSFLKRSFDVDVYLHPLDKPILSNFENSCKMYQIPGCEPFEADKFYEEGEQFKFGNIVFDIIHVPGHAPGHIALIDKENAVVFGGDCLFHRSIGRTDLPLGDYDTLINSIKTKFFTLPDNYKVYAGHMQPTTIGEEKIYNPFLQ